MLQESYLCCGLMGKDLHSVGQYGSQEFPQCQENVASVEGELELEGCEGLLLSPKVMEVDVLRPWLLSQILIFVPKFYIRITSKEIAT